MKADRPRSTLSSVLLVGLVALLAVEIARTAWMSDDAYVTLRTLDNALHGHGLTFNPIERVQAYTHPLWMALLAVPYALTEDAWRAPMAVGFVTTAAAVAVTCLGVARDRLAAAVAVSFLVASKGFVDYATSGLENPLVNLLLAVQVWWAYRTVEPRPMRAVLMLALLFLARPDAVLLGAPLAAFTVVAAFRAGEGRRVLLAPLALLPAVAWLVFAVVYYGDPLPNTFHAKLEAGISRGELWTQGLRYLAWSLRVDPVTLGCIAAGAVAGIVGRDLRAAALTAGSVGYILFVVAIGGDFMGGRFLVAPLFLGALAVARLSFRPWVAAGCVALVLAGSALSPWSPLRSGPTYERAPPSDGVVDERGYYWGGTGYLAEGAGRRPTHPFVTDGRAARGTAVAVKSVIGLYGYAAGPSHHVVDRLGLADPLLARLPTESAADWRIGHYRRAIPDGYLSSVLGENRIVDPEIHALYDRVRRATRGPLFTVERWQAIGELLRGERGPPARDSDPP